MTFAHALDDIAGKTAISDHHPDSREGVAAFRERGEQCVGFLAGIRLEHDVDVVALVEGRVLAQDLEAAEQKRQAFEAKNAEMMPGNGSLSSKIEGARAEHPGVNVIVHPECRREVVAAADAVGSTEQIAKVIGAASAGETFS